MIFVAFSLSGCIKHSSIFIDNSSCRQSFADGIYKIIKSDSDVKKLVEQHEREELEKLDSNLKKLVELTSLLYQAKKEFYDFGVSVSIKEAKFSYRFMFQTDDDICWLRLYKRHMKSGGYSSKTMNLITFIDSYQLKDCKCGGTKIVVPVSP